jgi:hypothetical protein
MFEFASCPWRFVDCTHEICQDTIHGTEGLAALPDEMIQTNGGVILCFGNNARTEYLELSTLNRRRRWNQSTFKSWV